MNTPIYPTPFSSAVPKAMQEEMSLGNAPAGLALCAYLDILISDISTLVYNIGRLQTAERCPVQFLPELGYLLAANILSSDTEAQMRQKIAAALSNRVYQGLFTNWLKAIIDGITGFSSSVWSDFNSNYPVEMSFGDLTWTDAIAGTELYPWSVEASGNDSYQGEWEIGSGVEWFISGNIMINLGDTGGMSSTIYNQVLAFIRQNILVAYLIINVGYVSSGTFIIYGTV